MLLHYFGILEVQILWKLHCALKMHLFYLTPWNLNWFSQFFHCWSHSEHLFICKEDEVHNKLGNFFRSSLQAVQFALVISCARHLLEHFSYRSFRMMQTTDDLGMSFFHDISRTAVSSELVLDSEPHRSPGQCIHPCGHFAICRCPDVCPLCPCLCSEFLEQSVNATCHPFYFPKFCSQLSCIICFNWYKFLD